MIENFYAHGKLLLTGEYFVLDGALALALPCKLGQSMTVQKRKSADSVLRWKSLDVKNEIWFEAKFDLQNFNILTHTNQQSAATLQQILQAARNQNSSFLKSKGSFQVETKLEFPRLWGLGSSSTLIYNIAKWSQTNAFRLLSDTMGGSGYDIACAGVDGPILYQKTNGDPLVERKDFDPPFHHQIYFVYLGKKQNSREGIKRYYEKVNGNAQLIKMISQLTEAILESTDLHTFEDLLLEHEKLISRTLELPRIQSENFSDFPGTVKSLGAWGGDFVMATSTLGDTKTKEYFNEKGFEVFFNYNELIL